MATQRSLLAGNMLQGQLPPELGNLSYLFQLDLSNNFLTGVIPTELGRLSSLIFLSLNSNFLRGPLPAEIFSLPLHFLDLSFNPINNIPPEFSQLTKLETLILVNTSLSGRFPQPLLQLRRLNELMLNDNELQGPLPPEIANITSLTTLSLSSNEFTGSVPDYFSNLTNLNTLLLNDNQFDGPFPIGVLKMPLTELLLDRNKFHGNIPPEIGNLPLLILSLSHNEFEGNLPDELGNIKSLRVIDVSYNNFTGDIPPGVGSISFTKGDFSHNDFTSIPTFFAFQLDVSYNSISALNFSINSTSFDASFNPISSISQDFWLSPFLTIVRLRYCALRNISLFAPSEYTPLSALQELELEGNFLGDWSDVEVAFQLTVAMNLRKFNARNANISGFITFPLSIQFTHLDVGENPLLSTSDCMTACESFLDSYLEVLLIDHTNICLGSCKLETTSFLRELDFSSSRACLTNEMLSFSSLDRLGCKNTSILPSFFPSSWCPSVDESLVIDNANQSVFFPLQGLACPQRLTAASGGVIDSDFDFLKLRKCFCGNSYFWDGFRCAQCPLHMICDPYVNGTNNQIVGPFYPSLGGKLADPALYPLAQLIECVTVTACNPPSSATSGSIPFPSFDSSHSSSSERRVCEAGRDALSRACSRCEEGFFALEVQCLECNDSTPYLVVFLLPVSIFLLAFYLWDRSSSPNAQAAGFSICLFGLQLLTCVEMFFHRHSSSTRQRDFPDVLMVFREAINFRLWSFDCWNGTIDLQLYVYIQLLLPLCGLIWLVISKIAHARYRTRFWYVMCFFLDLGYFPLCITTFEVFTCDQHDYLSVAPYLRCDDLLVLQVVASLCIVFYCLGVPIWFNRVLWKHRQNFRSPEMSHLRFLIDNLNDADPRIVGWPIWKYVSRLCLALIVAQIPTHQEWPPIVLLAVFSVIAAVHAHAYPYRNRIDNMLEMFVFTGCGIVFLMSMLEATAEYRSFEWVRTALYYFVSFVLLVGISLYFLTPLWRRWKRGERGQDGAPLIDAKSESGIILY